MIEVPPALHSRLREHRQDHVLVGWDGLSPAERSTFVEQLHAIDFDLLGRLHRHRNDPQASLPPGDRIAPVPFEDGDAISEASREVGEKALRRGEVAALLVAGGQGTRLGFDRPKGMYPVGPVTKASLFQIHAEKVLALGRRHGRPIPFLVMTSPATNAETRTFFESQGYFGLAPEDVFFFQQGTMPALEIETGRLILEKPGSLFLSPNGHGGTLTALAETGLLGELRALGIRHVFYFQVDNPLVRICDPGFLGRHIETRSEASSRTVLKERPEEKVGVLGLVDGRCGIIEYSDMPAEMAHEREANGELRFRAGSPAIHLFSVDFLERVAAGTGTETGLSFHIARKKVPYYDAAAGQVAAPGRENALKFEMFIFDALPLAERWLVVQARREDEFAPLKNATGPDSPRTVHDLLVNRFAGWLERAGVTVPRDGAGRPRYPIEISSGYALDEEELRTKLPNGFQITGPTMIG